MMGKENSAGSYLAFGAILWRSETAGRSDVVGDYAQRYVRRQCNVTLAGYVQLYVRRLCPDVTFEDYAQRYVRGLGLPSQL